MENAIVTINFIIKILQTNVVMNVIDVILIT